MRLQSQEAAGLGHRTVVRALLAFVAGTLICSMTLAGVWWLDSGHLFSREQLSWSADDLSVLGAREIETESTLRLTNLTLDTEAAPYLAKIGNAVVTTGRISVESEHFSHFECRCRLSDVDLEVVAFWRSENKPGELHKVPLEFGPGGTMRMLSNQAGWGGRIAELGFAVEGAQDAIVDVESIHLYSDSIWVRFKSLWASWLVFRPWQGYSINFPHLDARDRPVPMVPMLALVTGLALLFLAAGDVIRGGWPSARGLVVVIVIGWLVLDTRWLVKMVQQNTVTVQTYAGLSLVERHQRLPDAPLHEFAEMLKKELEGGERRIFIFSDHPYNHYLHLRATWHLLPHRVLDARTRFRPLRAWTESGDYILVLADAPELEYREQKGVLHWRDGINIPAELVLRDDIGALYRVTDRHE